MEQGFSDACISLCMEQMPVPRVAQTCRAAAIGNTLTLFVPLAALNSLTL